VARIAGLGAAAPLLSASSHAGCDRSRPEVPQPGNLILHLRPAVLELAQLRHSAAERSLYVQACQLSVLNTLRSRIIRLTRASNRAHTRGKLAQRQGGSARQHQFGSMFGRIATRFARERRTSMAPGRLAKRIIIRRRRKRLRKAAVRRHFRAAALARRALMAKQKGHHVRARLLLRRALRLKAMAIRAAIRSKMLRARIIAKRAKRA